MTRNREQTIIAVLGSLLNRQGGELTVFADEIEAVGGTMIVMNANDDGSVTVTAIPDYVQTGAPEPLPDLFDYTMNSGALQPYQKTILKKVLGSMNGNPDPGA